jgi:hypothetical protein
MKSEMKNDGTSIDIEIYGSGRWATVTSLADLPDEVNHPELRGKRWFLEGDIEGIGYLSYHRTGYTLNLTPEASEACGHWADEGAGGSPEETEHRRLSESVARLVADLTGSTVEIFAEGDDGDGWKVGEVAA